MAETPRQEKPAEIKKGTITVQCSNCPKILGTKEASGPEDAISHGLCEDCMRKLYGDEMTDRVLEKIREEELKNKKENKE